MSREVPKSGKDEAPNRTEQIVKSLNPSIPTIYQVKIWRQIVILIGLQGFKYSRQDIHLSDSLGKQKSVAIQFRNESKNKIHVKSPNRRNVFEI